VKITRINHMAYNIAGVATQAREFYTKLLGLTEVPIRFPGREPVFGSDLAFWIEQEGVQMHLIGLPRTGEPREPTNTHVSWFVADLDVAIAQIRAAGLEMRQLGEGLGRIVWISDPAGNTIELQQDPEVAAGARARA
jgi:catechol 2,3-dioxygenase-like lactoylglutathione lyase family enzyme